MNTRTNGALAILTVGILTGTAVHAHAAEIGFLEMLFGARPAAQAVQSAPAAQPAPDPRRSYRRPDRKLGFARHRLQTRYAALPVKIHVTEKPAGDRQVSIDMSGGAAAALMKDETLQPGDIVVLNTGARVFTGDPDKRHAMSDFEPVQRSAYVDKSTRKLLVGMMTPVGARPAEEARRVVARVSPASAETVAPVQATAMRVINPWQTNP